MRHAIHVELFDNIRAKERSSADQGPDLMKGWKTCSRAIRLGFIDLGFMGQTVRPGFIDLGFIPLA